jgi:hypothetical protein
MITREIAQQYPLVQLADFSFTLNNRAGTTIILIPEGSVYREETYGHAELHPLACVQSDLNRGRVLSVDRIQQNFTDIYERAAAFTSAAGGGESTFNKALKRLCRDGILSLDGDRLPSRLTKTNIVSTGQHYTRARLAGVNPLEFVRRHRDASILL